MLPVYCFRETKVTQRNMAGFGFFFQRRVQLEQLRMEAVQDAKRMSLAKRGKMEEKEKMKREVEERVKLGLVEESIAKND